MPGNTPEELHRVFAEAFDSGDVDTLVALYEPGAALIVQPGEEPVKGTEAIREAYNGVLSWFAEKPKFELRFCKAFQAGHDDDLALVISRWTLTGRWQDGSPLEMTGQTADVVRRQADGTWRLAIDNPFGDAALAEQ